MLKKCHHPILDFQDDIILQNMFYSLLPRLVYGWDLSSFPNSHILLGIIYSFMTIVFLLHLTHLACFLMINKLFTYTVVLATRPRCWVENLHGPVDFLWNIRINSLPLSQLRNGRFLTLLPKGLKKIVSKPLGDFSWLAKLSGIRRSKINN